MQQLPDITCPHCGRLLAKGIVISGTLEFKCRCKYYFILRAESPNTEPHDGLQERPHVQASAPPA